MHAHLTPRYCKTLQDTARQVGILLIVILINISKFLWKTNIKKWMNNTITQQGVCQHFRVKKDSSNEKIRMHQKSDASN